jgi:hypothetical protein
MTVVTILKLDDRSPDFLQVPEDATVNGLFLQGPVEALNDAVIVSQQLLVVTTVARPERSRLPIHFIHGAAPESSW